MWSEEVKLDAQQRVTLPKNLLEFAGIDGKVAIIGMIDHIEFWNPEKFWKLFAESEWIYEAVVEKVMVV